MKYLKMLFFLPLFLGLSTQAKAKDGFDCRPYLLSKAVFNGIHHTFKFKWFSKGGVYEFERRGPLKLTPKEAKKIENDEAMETFDWINASASLVGKRAKGVDQWMNSRIVPVMSEGYLRVNLAQRYDDFVDWIGELQNNSTSETALKVQSIVEDLNGRVCDTCFCQPKVKVSDDQGSLYLFTQYHLVSFEEAKNLVKKRLREVSQ